MSAWSNSIRINLPEAAGRYALRLRLDAQQAAELLGQLGRVYKAHLVKVEESCFWGLPTRVVVNTAEDPTIVSVVKHLHEFRKARRHLYDTIKAPSVSKNMIQWELNFAKYVSEFDDLEQKFRSEVEPGLLRCTGLKISTHPFRAIGLFPSVITTDIDGPAVAEAVPGFWEYQQASSIAFLSVSSHWSYVEGLDS